jgi:16S rRNA A1518/A1519 N6-dimethyltransferase RsmA/KsgA/DIM1 with predicted DNA glycosylase/AP lyase activity
VNSNSPYPETADIETSSEEYASRFSGEVGEWFLKVQEEATLNMLAPYKRATILDVGGGHGQLTGALIRNNYQLTVLGSSEVYKARIQNYLDNENCSFKVGNIRFHTIFHESDFLPIFKRVQIFRCERNVRFSINSKFFSSV